MLKHVSFKVLIVNALLVMGLSQAALAESTFDWNFGMIEKRLNTMDDHFRKLRKNIKDSSSFCSFLSQTELTAEFFESDLRIAEAGLFHNHLEDGAINAFAELRQKASSLSAALREVAEGCNDDQMIARAQELISRPKKMAELSANLRDLEETYLTFKAAETEEDNVKELTNKFAIDNIYKRIFKFGPRYSDPSYFGANLDMVRNAKTLQFLSRDEFMEAREHAVTGVYVK